MELRSTPQRSRSSSTSKMSRSRTINSQTGWSNRSESCSPTWQRRKRESRSASLSVRAICRRNRSNSRTRSASRKMRSRTRSRSNRSRSRSRMRSRSRSRMRSRSRTRMRSRSRTRMRSRSKTRMRSRTRSRPRRSRLIRGRYRRSRSSSRTRSASRKIRPRSRISSSRSRTRSRSRSRRHKITRSRSTSGSCSSSRIKSRRLRSRSRTRSSSKGRPSKTRSRTRSLSKRRSSSSGRIRSTSMEPRSIPQRSRSTSTRMSRSRTFTFKTGRSNRGRYRRSRSSSRTRSALRKIRSWSRRSSSRSRTRSSSRSRTRSRSRSTSRIKSRRHRTRSSSRSRTSKTRSRIRLPSKRRSMSRLSNHSKNSNFSFSSGSTRERRSWLEYRYRTRPSPPTTESLGFGSSRFSTQPHRLTSPDIIRSRTPTAENISPDTTFTTRVTASNIASVTTAAPSTVTEAAAVTTTVAIPDIDREMFPYIKQEDIDYFKNLLKTPKCNVSHQELQKRELIGMLLKKKNGPPQVAKMSSKSLQQLARRMDPCLLLNTILPICLHPTDTESQAKIIASLDLIIFKLGRKIKPFLQKVLVVVQPLLVSSAYKYRRTAIRIVSKLTKVCGMASMIVSVRIDLEAVDKYVRNLSCQTAAIVASIVGLDKMFPFLRSLTTSKLSAILNNSGFKILQLTAQLMGTKARPHVRLMVELIEHVFDQIPSEEAVPSLECLEAVAATAKIAQKNDWLALEKIWNTLLSMYRAIPRLMQTKKYQLKPQRAEVTQKAMAALLHLKPSLSDEEMSALHTGFAYVCSREGPSTVKILHKLLKCPSVSATYYQDNYLTPFITTQLSGFTSYGAREKLEFIKVCTKSCQKVEVEKMCISLLIGFHSQNDDHIKLASETLVDVLKKRPREVTFDTEKKIITEFFNAINMDDSEDTQLLKLFLALLEILGERLYLHVFDIQNTLTNKPQGTDERKHLLDQVLLMLSGCNQSGGMSGLVADGSIHNLRDAM